MKDYFAILINLYKNAKKLMFKHKIPWLQIEGQFERKN